MLLHVDFMVNPRVDLIYIFVLDLDLKLSPCSKALDYSDSFGNVSVAFCLVTLFHSCPKSPPKSQVFPRTTVRFIDKQILALLYAKTTYRSLG